MSAKIEKIDILEVELPFKGVFKHALRARKSSGSIFVKIRLENGITGYGEALPREYVTGETSGSVRDRLRGGLLRKLIGAELSSLEQARDFIENFEGLEGASRCAVELALLDAVGKYAGRSVSSILGEKITDEVFYSGVVSAGSAVSAAKNALKLRLFGFRQVKLKVGAGDDLKRLKVIRGILGGKVNIRVDANGAWSAGEAIDNIEKMRKFAVSAVEQPVKADDLEGLKRVTDVVPEKIIADESLCTIEDGRKLASLKACDMFNIRLSKCGGMLNAVKLADIARGSSISYQLGCQVGESGVLSAAGRHFACSVKDVKYAEGSYGKFLLKEDVTKEDMTFKRGGKAPALGQPGLGVNVLDDVLDRYTVNRSTVE